ncbi:hypothetical protein C8Q77DRAFT_714203 [Trametes polyzona]|nr:hypothetical protein C8Q77DRAFT_714203 [Trametes polyzona]
MNYQQLPLNTPFLTAAFSGFVGGDAAASAHAVSYLYGRRNVPSLYNSPGSYGVAKRLAAVVRSQFWDGLHGGASADPNALTQNTPSPGGPKFVASFSGTTIAQTSELAQVLVDHCKKQPVDSISQGRITTPYAVTVTDIHRPCASEVHPTLKVAAPFLPILASIGASAGCAVIGDWAILLMIVLGMICNAGTSTVLRSGDLTFTRPNSTPGAPAGDGFLEAGNEFVVLRGSDDAVSTVTRGYFSLRFKDENALGCLATAATLCTIQCLAQLLIVPQGTVLGQVLFLFSIAVAWLYHSHLASVEKEAKAKVVVEDLLDSPSMRRYNLGTRTTMAVFLMQVLKPTNIEEQLAALIPNNTRVWQAWKKTVARRLRDEKPFFGGALPAEASDFNAEESVLMRTLLNDAQAAVNVYATTHARL